jgi:hypothetical protein
MFFRIARPSLTALWVSMSFSFLMIALTGSAEKTASPSADNSRDGAGLQKLVKRLRQPGMTQMLNRSLCFTHPMDSS